MSTTKISVAELAEVENALLGDDAADQEGDQHHTIGTARQHTCSR
jgi:hypothetical protein